MTESELQSSIKKSLKQLGYIAMSTSRYNTSANRRGASEPGIPDILVTHKNWRPGMWLGLEVKTDKGKLKPEQAELLEAQRIFVVRSWEEAWNAVQVAV
jgi:hypothetical protein